MRTLDDLGVKTLISVDALPPNVELAKQFGLRYVHLPHGYDGIPPSRAAELAKAVRDLPGRVYIHCHHGLHRSPAAAAVACIGAGTITPSTGAALLELAGTHKRYLGLHAAVASARAYSPHDLDAMPASFPRRVEPSPIAASMIEIERRFTLLKEHATAGWRTSAELGDAPAEYHALIIRENYAELLRSSATLPHSDGSRESFRQAERIAAELESNLRQTPRRSGAVDQAFGRLAASCSSCHQQHRDAPQDAGHLAPN
ncbi:MAG: hypothetical protein AAGJ46_13625 [Planctomycetota bacterium]